MSFQSMKRDDLYRMAVEQFGCDIEQTATKMQIIGVLNQDGVTWEQAKLFDPAAAATGPVERVAEPLREGDVIKLPVDDLNATLGEAVVSTDPVGHAPLVITTDEPSAAVVITPPAPVVPEKVLLKMDRENGTYEIRGYHFTRKNPFAVVTAEDANYICSEVEGFHIATPGEAQEFYK